MARAGAVRINWPGLTASMRCIICGDYRRFDRRWSHSNNTDIPVLAPSRNHALSIGKAMEHSNIGAWQNYCLGNGRAVCFWKAYPNMHSCLYLKVKIFAISDRISEVMLDLKHDILALIRPLGCDHNNAIMSHVSQSTMHWFKAWHCNPGDCRSSYAEFKVRSQSPAYLLLQQRDHESVESVVSYTQFSPDEGSLK